MDHLVLVGAWAGALLALLGLCAAIIKGLRFFDNVGRLVRHEMTHNGGSSMKDDTKLARVVSQETFDVVTMLREEFASHVIEGNAYMLGLERELGSIQTRLKTLEDDPSEVQSEADS